MSEETTAPEPTAARRRWARPAIGQVVTRVTRTATEQTANASATRRLAGQLHQRYQRLGDAQRAGHVFELMHADGFNRAAIDRGSRLRAHVTTWLGNPTAAADLQVTAAGQVVGEAQAKVCGDPVKTALDQARAKYEGMQRLVPEDQLEGVNRVLDKRATLNPEGLRYDEYLDARAHTADRLRAGDVESKPVTRDQAQHAAQDPTRWADQRLARARAQQAATAAAAGAAAGAVTAGIMDAAAQAARVRAGETSVAAAASSAAGAAARGAVREGSLAGVSEAIKVAAAAGKLHPSLGTGSLPGAVAGAVFEVSEAGYAYARGTIDARELAARSCRSSMRTGLVWACGTVGQTVIPVPVVGALAGGLVGQWSATVIAEGLQTAVAVARQDALDEQRIAELEVEVAEAVAAAALLAEAELDLGRQRNAHVTTTVAPMLDDALVAVAEGSDNAIERLTELTRSYAGHPLFCTVEEFDLWMADPDTVLVLNPNPA